MPKPDTTKLRHIYHELSTPEERLEDFLEAYERGDLNGTDGRTPSMGELIQLIRPLIPPPEPAQPGPPGPAPSKQELLKIILPLIPPAIPGKRGSPDTGAEIVSKIKGIKRKKDRMSIFDLKDLEWFREWLGKGRDRMQWSSAGATNTGGGSMTFYNDTVSGVIDGVNTVFTVSNTIQSALFCSLANSSYQAGIDYNVSGPKQITFTIAPDASLVGQPFWLAHS